MEEEQTQIKSVLIWFPGKYLPLLLLLLMKCLGSILHSHLGRIPPRYYETFSRRMLMMKKTKKGTWLWNKIIRWLKEDRGHTNGWLHFCRLPFPPLVYEALVINQPFRPQFRSLGTNRQRFRLFPHHWISIEITHLACPSSSCLNSFKILALPPSFPPQSTRP